MKLFGILIAYIISELIVGYQDKLEFAVSDDVKQIYMVKLFLCAGCMLFISNPFFIKVIILLIVVQVLNGLLRVIHAFIPLAETMSIFHE